MPHFINGKPKNKASLERTIRNFWCKIIKKENEICWPWFGAKDSKGYGSFNLNGKIISAHRFSYILKYGSIPKNLLIRHKCDRPSCVNPEHLELGTFLDNAKDCVLRKREPNVKLDKNPNAKLTLNQVKEIKNRLAYLENQLDLSKEFKVYLSTIERIKANKDWKNA